jgi:beta-glucosidase-like glycosyl hydrolase
MTLDEKASQIQHESPAIPRLGIPAYNWWSEGLHGVARADIATVFPQAIGLAATWDTPLVRRVGEVTGIEFRAKFLNTVGADGASVLYRGLTVWSPNVNIFRDPRWGRGQETYGEDPFLTSRMGVAFIQGLQGPDPTRPRVSAAVKHFAVHSGPEADRHKEDVRVSPRDLVDTYLPAFHAAVTQGRAESVMCAYNAVDGVPACANEHLLQHYLRGEWKFQGHVVSDCGAVADIHMDGAHHHVKTPEAAVALAVRAGTDLICDFSVNSTAAPATTVAAVRQGLLSEAELDRALHRLFDVRLRLGLLDPPGQRPFAGITARDFDTPAHRALNLEAARRSLVLLKNDGLLPLKTPPLRIALIGPNADSVDALVGNYNGTPSRPITLLAGLKARFPQARIDVVEGAARVALPEGQGGQGSGQGKPRPDAQAALAAAREADLVVFASGLNSELEGEEMPVVAPGFAGGDRTSIDLPEPQQQLLDRLTGLGRPLVLVNFSGSAMAFGAATRQASAIVQAWYPGGEGGQAVAELIAGDFSPSGRLPVTFYQSAGQLPPFKDYGMQGRTYRWFKGEPLFPFGHGLGYARFSYAQAKLAKTRVTAGQGTRLSVLLRNESGREAAEVVQVYARRAGDMAPERTLVAFQRVVLGAGESRRLTVELDAKAMSIVQADGRRVVEPGPVTLWIGGGQPVAAITGARAPGQALTLQVTGRARLQEF